MNPVQIIIPMTGAGTRFKQAGYDRLKPFIQVHGKPIVEWVVKMFPGDEDKITFICRQEHLDNIEYMETELRRIAPQSDIFSVQNWEKKGPVGDILRASDSINDERPVIVCYCDFYMHWDYAAFKKGVSERDCGGAVPCYGGFHPHLIPKANLYASCKVDERENLIEIREKFSWEEDKMKSRHSPGIYYFKTGGMMKSCCQKMIDAADSVKGEYYASLPFNYLLEEGHKVWCPVNVDHFCQWGTPKDLEDFLFWTDTIRGFWP